MATHIDFPDPRAELVASMRKLWGRLYDAVVEIMRQADIFADHLLSRFDPDFEIQWMLSHLHKAQSPDDVENLILEAFTQGNTRPRILGEQERLRLWWASHNIWDAWVEYQEETDPTLRTRAGELLTHRQLDM